MNTTEDQGAGETDDDLLQIARNQVARISTAAGLVTPVVVLVDSIEGKGSPRANAKFTTPDGVPTITVTKAAVRKLPFDVLEVLLGHELGHHADESWWRRKRRQYLTGWGMAGLLLIGGVLAGAIADSNDASWIPGLAVAGVGGIVYFRSFFVFRRNQRVGEVRADVFAARQHTQVDSARALFAVWESERPESPQCRHLRLPFRSHPYRATRLKNFEAEHRRNEAGRSAS